MACLALASREQIEAIYRESHAVWGAGLSPVDYMSLWDDISNTAWARKYARFYAWLGDNGEVLSSLKLYRPLLKVRGRTCRVGVLGAVFTPRAQRRRGHASSLMRAVLENSRRQGDRLSLLFTDIGTGYYASLGFRALPAEEQWGKLPRRPVWRPPGWSLRLATDADLDSIHRAHEETCRNRSIAVLRDEEHWRYLGVRSEGYFSRLHTRVVGQQALTAQRDGKFAGYIITVEGGGEWNVREVGALGGDPQAMAAIVRLGAFRAWLEGMSRFYAWLPREVVELLDGWKIRCAPRRRAIPMIQSLDRSLDLDWLGDPRAAYIPYQDQF